jgi:hypothetical protein
VFVSSPDVIPWGASLKYIENEKIYKKFDFIFILTKKGQLFFKKK